MSKRLNSSRMIYIKLGKVMLFLIVPALLVGQDSVKGHMDSLVHAIEKLKRLENLVQSSNTHSEIDTLEASIQLAMANQDTIGIIDSYLKMGIWFYSMDDLNNSTKSYLQALRFLREVETDYYSLARTFHNIGWNLAKQNKPQLALEYYNKALDYQRKTKNVRLLGWIYNSIGILHKNDQDYQLALHYQLQALDISKMLNDSAAMVKNYNNLGVIYSEMDEGETSMGYISEALKLNYRQNDKVELVNNLNNLAIVLKDMGACSQALDSLDKAREFSTQDRNLTGQMITCYNLYLVHRCLGDDEKALQCYIGYTKVADSLRSLAYDKELLQIMQELKVDQFRKDNETLMESYMEKESELILARNWLYLLLLLAVISIALILVLRRLITIKKTHTESLEEIISIRTKELCEKNERLEEIVFMNAHNLRAPLSRILMIFSVMDLGIQNLEIDPLATIKSSAEEMDEAIHIIINALSSEQNKNPKDLCD